MVQHRVALQVMTEGSAHVLLLPPVSPAFWICLHLRLHLHGHSCPFSISPTRLYLALLYSPCAAFPLAPVACPMACSVAVNRERLCSDIILSATQQSVAFCHKPSKKGKQEKAAGGKKKYPLRSTGEFWKLYNRMKPRTRAIELQRKDV